MVPGDGPILISEPVLEKLATGIDFDRKALTLRTGGEAALSKAQSGHLLLQLAPPSKEMWDRCNVPLIQTDELLIYQMVPEVNKDCCAMDQLAEEQFYDTEELLDVIFRDFCIGK